MELVQEHKKKVVAILNRLDIGGTAMNTFPLMNGLQEFFDVTILYGDRDSDASVISYYQINYPSINIVPVRTLNNSYNIFQDFVTINFISKWLKKEQVQLVHTHGSKAGFVGRIAAKNSKIPITIHTYHGHFFHSYFGKIKTGLFILLERYLSKITTHLITLSNSQLNDICNVYKISNTNKTSIIQLGIQPDNFIIDKEKKRNNFRDRFKLTSNQIAIGIVGRLAPIKNHYLFIDAALLLLKNDKTNIVFFIVGDGEKTNTVKKYLSHQLKIAFGNLNDLHHFVFTSWYTEIEEVQNGLDIVVLTSSNEGTPLSIIEAQVCGKPVVVTNVGGVSDTVINNETGFVVENNNSAIIASKLKDLINDEALRLKLGQKATEFATVSFSLQKQILQTKNLYNQLLEANRT